MVIHDVKIQLATCAMLFKFLGKLLQCVRVNDEEQIKKLTESGIPNLINFNEPNDGETALSTAAVRNMDTMIAFLLEMGAHPDVCDFKGRTAVMRAAEYGHIQCMQELATNKTNMRMTDLEGKGVLFYCLSPTQRHARCLNIALTYGADVNNKTKEGIPILLYAAEEAKEIEDMVVLLLDKGAEPTGKQDRTNRTALMAACKSGNAKVVTKMLVFGAHAVIDQIQNKPKINAAHEAARAGSLECLQALSSFGARFDVYDEGANNPVHYGAAAGHAMCCKFLSQRGCNPKPKNSDGNQPKAIAKENGFKDAMKECRKSEKSFGKTGKNNDPWALALYDFVYARQDQMRDRFQSLDVEKKNTLSREDFLDCLEIIGAPMPNEEETKRLLNAHSGPGREGEINYEDFITAKKYVNKQYLMSAFEGKKKKKKGKKGGKKKGKTKIAFDICTQADGPRTVDGGPPQLFVPRHIHYTDNGRFDRDRPPEHPLEDDSGWYLHRPEKRYMNINDVTKHADLDTLKDALNRGVNVDIRDKYFKTPLMIAAVNGNIKVADFLVEKGANVEARDNFKWTPLHFACHAGIQDLVEFLLEKGADLEAKTLNEATPLMRAIESSKPELVQYLIDRGAKVQIENRKGQSPLDLAAAWGDFRVYDIIKTKVDSMPPANDKKKGGKGGKGGAKGGGKRPKSSTSGDANKDKSAATGKPSNESLEDSDSRRKGSILRAASALAGGIEEVEDITYIPLKGWTKQKSTKELIREREINRDRFGWEVDFADFKMPFLQHVDDRVVEEGGFDDDD